MESMVAVGDPAGHVWESGCWVGVVPERSWELRRRDPVELISVFMYYNNLPDSEYRDPEQARRLAQQGDAAMERQNYEELTAVLYQLSALKIDREQRDSFSGTGLG